MTTLEAKRTDHDEFICFCDTDLGRAAENVTASPVLTCGCQCVRCQKVRESIQRAHRIAVLEARLVKAGIDINDLAEVIRLRIAEAFQSDIERIAREECKLMLSGIALVTRAKW